MPHVENSGIVETTTEARGAVRGRPVLYVLVSGTVGVIGLFTMVYMYFFA